METSEALGVVDTLHATAQERGLFFLTDQSERIVDRRLRLGGRDALAFTSCSYLGLERHPALVAGVHDAVERYGTQFSSSRGYVSAPLYAELEPLLDRVFGGHALAVGSTTLGHQIALPVLATEKDAIVLDHQVHHSVHMAANLARAGGARVEVVRHNALDTAVDVVRRLARTARTVWFATDGVFSMYGDLAPLGLLRALLDAAPNVRLYVDDAHGMSWAGLHGRGSFLSRMPLHERMVLATSLNKAFSAGGGCLVFPTRAERDRVLRCGGPMVFSGPLQPPMLGAAVASARVHLSPEIVERQEALARRTRYTNERMRELDLPLLVENESPIFFVALGLPRVSFAVAERLLAEGIYVNVSMYPSVPMKRSGIRFTVTARHEEADIARALEALSRHLDAVLDEERTSREDIQRLFAQAVPEEARRSERYRALAASRLSVVHGGGSRAASSFDVQVCDTIREVPKEVWDPLLGGVGSCSWDALDLAERVFTGHGRREYDWDFRYVLVRERGRPVAATFFTVSLAKDDMLMRDEVSQAVERRRVEDPYFLTSEVVGMGSGFSEGNHLFLDRAGPWQAALDRVLEVMSGVYEERGAGMWMLRDLPGDDPEMDAFLVDRGLVKVPMFPSHLLDVTWTSMDGFYASLSRRSRHRVREIGAQAARFQRRVWGRGGSTLSAEDQNHLYRLYRNVADRKRRLNVFPLPPNLVGGLLTSPAWEVVTLHLPPALGGPADGRAVGWYAAHLHAGHYAPFLCGLDYDYVYTHGVYRSMIWWMVARLLELGAHTCHMGMDADTEKARFGTRTRPNAVYVQVRDHFNAGLLREIVAEVGVDAGGGLLTA